MKRLLGLFVLLLVAGTARADFILNNTSLPSTKTDLRPVPSTADPTKYMAAADYNALMQALLDTRLTLTTGSYWGLNALAADPNARLVYPSANYVWYKNDGTLHFYNGTDHVFLLDGPLAYTTVQNSGTNLTARRILNFTGAGVSCADNAGSSRTDCTITSGGGGLSGLTTNVIPVATSATTIGNSNLTWSSGNIDVQSGALTIGPTVATQITIGRSGVNLLLPGGVLRAATAAANTGGVNFTIGLNNGGAAGSGLAAGGGGATNYISGQGGAATSNTGETAGDGGGTSITGGQGGNGAASVNGPGKGGGLFLTGGTAGTVTSGFGGNAGGATTLAGGVGSGTGNGGNVFIRGGAKGTSGANGSITIGDTNTSSIGIGASTVTSTFSGPVTLNGTASTTRLTLQASASQTANLLTSLDSGGTNTLASLQVTDSGQSNELFLTSQLNGGYTFQHVSTVTGSVDMQLNGGVLLTSGSAGDYRWYSSSFSVLYGTISSSGITSALTGSFHHVAGNGTAPTKAAGTCLGGTQTVTLDANATDVAGYITLGSTATGTASATCATVTFNTTYATAPHCHLDPANASAVALTGAGQLFIDSASVSTSAFVIKNGGTALPSGTYIFYYGCVQ